MRTAILACGGGARGIIQAGMLEYLAESKFKYDGIFGASVGAINASLFHTGQIQDLLDLWFTIKTSDVYSLNPLLLPFRLLSKDASLYDNTPLKRRLMNTVSVGRLRSNPIPFLIRATNTAQVKGISIAPKDPAFMDYLVASASPPLAFPPVRMGSNVLVDGGIYDNFGIEEAIDAGFNRLIVLAPTCPAPNMVLNIGQAFDVLASAPEYTLDLQLKMVAINNKRVDKKFIQVVLIRPEKPMGIGLLDFDLGTKERRSSLIAYGYDLAKKALSTLQ